MSSIKTQENVLLPSIKQASRRQILASAALAMVATVNLRHYLPESLALPDRALPDSSSGAPPAAPMPVDVRQSGNHTIGENGFICIEFDADKGAITRLAADFFGRGLYQNNLLGRDGIRLEGVTAGGKIIEPRIKAGAAVAVGKKTEKDQVSLNLPLINLAGGADGGASVTSQWTIVLEPAARWFELQLHTHIVNDRHPDMVRLRFGCNQWFFNALYDRGNMQRIEGLSQAFCSHSPLHVFYTMDRENGSISIVPQQPDATPESNLFSGTVSQWGGSECGLDQVLCGTSNILDSWVPLRNIHPAGMGKSPRRSIVTAYRVYASDKAFPVHTLPPKTNMEFNDLAALYTTIYGSSAGVMGSYQIPGSAYPNLATPGRPYGIGNSFFDPDAWETVSMLSYSGDPLLARLARQVVERSGKYMSDEGQIPHNFNGKVPTDIALSGATQSGPNVFWAMACLDYVMGTGDEPWLKSHYPLIKIAVEWLLARYDPKVKLVKFTGSLFIDVFIRYGYTLDTNMATVGLLELMAPVSEFSGDVAGARRYRELHHALSEGIRAKLWNGKDHFVTQRNTNGTIRDFVDYDGNFGALAFGVVKAPAWRAAMFSRLDNGPHTHPGGRGTWVSEKYYGPADCYHGNTGDSATAMGRIWWLDMKSRHRYPTISNCAMFNRTYHNIRGDLLANTWLTERYNAQGQCIRTPYYHEYPEIVSMVMRTMRYGIDVYMDRVVIRPIEPIAFDYQVGHLHVTYGPERVIVRIPGQRKIRYEIFHLTPHAAYRISNGLSVKADAAGRIEFPGNAGVTYILQKI